MQVVFAKDCSLCEAIAQALLAGVDPGPVICFQHGGPTKVYLQGAAMEGQTDINSGVKHDGGKPPMALLPSEPLFEIARVLEFGKKKYEAFNWAKGIGWLRVMSAVLRHCYQWLAGQDKDPETGLSHLAHASCGLLFLLEYEHSHRELDDRYKGLTGNDSPVPSK